VLGNLLSNAIKYSPEGGDISVEVTQEEGPAGAWAVVVVRDQGLGIPAADLPHILERFQRAGNVIGRISGSGVGLASARQIVEQHGGTIAVASEERRGSTFTVRLPLAPQESEIAAVASAATPSTRGS
jgi:signal transduction histidine kinase